MRFQPAIHFVIESSISRESVTMQARVPGGSERRPSSAAVYSIRLFVVCASLPERSSVTPSGQTTIAAQPPGPGLPEQAPSVHTRTSPSRGASGCSGRAGRRGTAAILGRSEDGTSYARRLCARSCVPSSTAS